MLITPSPKRANTFLVSRSVAVGFSIMNARTVNIIVANPIVYVIVTRGSTSLVYFGTKIPLTA